MSSPSAGLPWWPSPGAAYERLTFGLDDLDTWDFPRGLITIGEDGLQVKRFGKTFNAVSTIGIDTFDIIKKYDITNRSGNECSG